MDIESTIKNSNSEVINSIISRVESGEDLRVVLEEIFGNQAKFLAGLVAGISESMPQFIEKYIADRGFKVVKQ